MEANEEVAGRLPGTGFGQKWGAEKESKDTERIMKLYTTPRGTHTLGIAFSNKPPKRDEEYEEKQRAKERGSG
jgi:hypothetical protein